MKAEGKITKAEGLLLGLAALFLCGLLVLARQDRLAARSAPLTAEPEHSVPAEEVTPVTDLNTATSEQLEALPGIGEELGRPDCGVPDGARRVFQRGGAIGSPGNWRGKVSGPGGPGNCGGNNGAMKILVVDDEKTLVKGIKFNLENEGYEVECAYDGSSAVELARNNRFDLLILDVMMPEVDGLEACMRIREFSNVPIIMLTAKSEDADKLMGFECGADDYLTKPFNILELKARVRALLRRAAGVQRDQGAVLAVGDMVLNTEERVAVRDGRTVDLTAKEYDLIELLMRNPRRVYSRENLMNVVIGGILRRMITGRWCPHPPPCREKLEKNRRNRTIS